MTVVFDATAVLALLKDERGAEVVAPLARGALLSAVNLVEVLSKLSDIVTDVEAAVAAFGRLEILTVPFTAAQARIAADLWPLVRGRDVSLADRVCLALAIERELPVYTGDRAWAELNLDVDVRLFR